jgi:hypothetical protein
MAFREILKYPDPFLKTRASLSKRPAMRCGPDRDERRIAPGEKG